MYRMVFKQVQGFSIENMGIVQLFKPPTISSLSIVEGFYGAGVNKCLPLTSEIEKSGALNMFMSVCM